MRNSCYYRRLLLLLLFVFLDAPDINNSPFYDFCYVFFLFFISRIRLHNTVHVAYSGAHSRHAVFDCALSWETSERDCGCEPNSYFVSAETPSRRAYAQNNRNNCGLTLFFLWCGFPLTRLKSCPHSMPIEWVGFWTTKNPTSVRTEVNTNNCWRESFLKKIFVDQDAISAKWHQ